MFENLTGRQRALLNILFRKAQASIPADEISGDISGLLPAGSVGTTTIADGAVTEPKLGVGAVTESKLADGAVTSDKILDGTIALTDLSTTLQALLGVNSAFSVHYNGVDNALAAGTHKLSFTTADFNHGSHYDLATNYRYDVPSAGLYVFILTVYARVGTVPFLSPLIYLDGAEETHGNWKAGAAMRQSNTAISVVSLSAGSYVEPYVSLSVGDTIEGDRTDTRFMGIRIGSLV